MGGQDQETDALVIGGGPAGLMAAEALLAAGRRVILAEHKPSVARKFLMAGKSGLNLAMMRDPGRVLAAYDAPERLRPMLAAFGSEQVRDWAEALGQETFIGSTGRLFPRAMKASPLLRAWLARLDAAGLERRTRWRWTGWDGPAATFETPAGRARLTPCVSVLALGGGSWARLGSDGAWAPRLAADGIAVTPFAPSNVGVAILWSAPMRAHFGKPLKGVAFQAGSRRSRGEAVISAQGLEGGGLYPLCPALRTGAALSLDLAPDLPSDAMAARIARPRGKRSLANHLRRVLGLSAQAVALLNEFARPLPTGPDALAALVKGVPIAHAGLGPQDEAISTAGGVAWDALDDGLMLKAKPGVFCAGEMIDWDAPTGGYLLTACLATGLWSGRHAAAWPG